MQTIEQIAAEIEALEKKKSSLEQQYYPIVGYSSDYTSEQIVVGCVRDSQIHIGDPAFRLIINGTYDKLIFRNQAEFIAKCMPNSAWEKLLEVPPLFACFDTGEWAFLTDGFCKPGMYKLPEEDKQIVEPNGHEDYKHCAATFD